MATNNQKAKIPFTIPQEIELPEFPTTTTSVVVASQVVNNLVITTDQCQGEYTCIIPIPIQGKTLNMKATFQFMPETEHQACPADPRKKRHSRSLRKQPPDFFEVKETARPITPQLHKSKPEDTTAQQVRQEFERNTETIIDEAIKHNQLDSQQDELIIGVTPDDETFDLLLTQEEKQMPQASDIPQYDPNNHNKIPEGSVDEERFITYKENNDDDTSYIPSASKEESLTIQCQQLTEALNIVKQMELTDKHQERFVHEDRYHIDRRWKKPQEDTRDKQDYEERLSYLRANPQELERLAMREYQPRPYYRSSPAYYPEYRDRYYMHRERPYDHVQRGNGRAYRNPPRAYVREEEKAYDSYQYSTDTFQRSKE